MKEVDFNFKSKGFNICGQQREHSLFLYYPSVRFLERLSTDLHRIKRLYKYNLHIIKIFTDK